jgi:hypothetical protein
MGIVARLLSASLSFLLTISCESNRIARLENENKKFKKELDRQKNIVSLDTQGKCSDASKQFFKENWSPSKNDIILDYSNHFNGALGKCFILIEWHYNDTNAGPHASRWFNDIWLYDVYEHNKYAEFAEGHTATAPEFKEVPTLLRCSVDGAKCSSLDDFYSKSKHWMSD